MQGIIERHAVNIIPVKGGFYSPDYQISFQSVGALNSGKNHHGVQRVIIRPGDFLEVLGIHGSTGKLLYGPFASDHYSLFIPSDRFQIKIVPNARTNIQIHRYGFKAGRCHPNGIVPGPWDHHLIPAIFIAPSQYLGFLYADKSCDRFFCGTIDASTEDDFLPGLGAYYFLIASYADQYR